MIKNVRGRRFSVKVKALIALLSTAIAIQSVTPVYAAKSLSEVNKQKQAAENDKKKAQDEYDDVKGEMDELAKNKEEIEEEIQQIDDELVDLILSVEVLTQDMEGKTAEIQDAQDKYDDAKQKETEKQLAMKRRIKFMYEKGNLSYMDAILQSKNTAELANKSEYAEKLYEYDRQLLDEYQQTKDEVMAKKAALECELSEMEEMQEDYLAKEQELNDLITQKRAAVDDFDTQLEAAQDKADEYKARISKQNEAIREYELEASQIKDEQERKKAEEALKKKLKEEEEKRRAEEARIKAEEERKKAEAAATTEDGKETDVVIDDNVEPEVKPEEKPEAKPEEKLEEVTPSDKNVEPVPAEEPKEEPKPEVTSDPGDAGKGQEIASYACQFVGNPYVPGGTSLTEGCDCSGFTSSVFAHFGISLPRNSYSQSLAGRAVDVSSMQPGDVVYYGGHVAIYIGNGSIVHASTQATGIKISNVYYRSIITVRRFV